ncbi:hypothetical protein M407DRAFT_16929 [Tulasnella calospora MUT 4182]|uniref:Uncharacterized protein n=1 Tax=Tulasnella calospora MUT 4182 TaxID=1051891 RepID=A0A0C3QWU5_9AGAM|nr:hypothetical protein M407DRAFT_16929 [Tulasnella calospora MUT 4182]
MVSMARSNALADPTKVLQDLYTERGNFEDFPAHATAHFDQLFATEDALQQISVLSISSQAHAPRSLVQFRGMVQDTMSPEVYLATVPVKGEKQLGGWGMADTIAIEPSHDEPTDDYSNLKERFVLWVVSVPGESDWLRENGSIESDTAPVRPHKYPLHSSHLGLQVKIYTPHKLKSTEVVNFVGILTSEELSTPAFDSDTSPPTVPTLHVLFTRSAPRTIVSGYEFPMEVVSTATTENADVVQNIESARREIAELRGELVSWMAEEALGGDREAAEWVLLVATSRV